MALIGLGRAGHFHLQSMLETEAVRLAWVIDTDAAKAQRIAAERRCRWATTLEEALTGPQAVQAVIVASSTER